MVIVSVIVLLLNGCLEVSQLSMRRTESSQSYRLGLLLACDGSMRYLPEPSTEGAAVLGPEGSLESDEDNLATLLGMEMEEIGQLVKGQLVTRPGFIQSFASVSSSNIV